MKKSEHQWLGHIPEDWRVVDLKYLTRLVNGAAFAPSDWGDEGVPIIRIVNLNGGEEFNYTKREVDPRYVVRKHDLLFGWSGNRGTSFGPFIWQHEGLYLLNQHIFRLEGYVLDKAFFYWLLKAVTAHVESQVSGIIGLVHITKEDLGNIVVPVPSQAEQRAIAAFLDRKTAEIDAVIAKKERLIVLLQEERQALISHTVAAQGNRRKARLAYYAYLLPGYAFPSTDFSHDPEDIRLLRGINVTPQGVSWDEVVYWKRTDVPPYSEFALQRGDLVFGMDRPKISSGIRVARIGTTDLPALLLQRVARLRAAEGLEQDYLELLLRSESFWGHLEPDMTGVSVPHVSPEQILSFEFWLPTLADQKAACSQVARQLLRINGLIRMNGEQINKLREYRQALISAAVTGKLAVPQEVAT